MESLKYSLKDKDAEGIASMILDNSIDLEDVLFFFDKNPNWIEDNTEGKISYSTLSKIIDRSNHNQKYGVFSQHKKF
jgi:hypothetical protein